MEQWAKTHNFCVWLKGFGINFHCFSMNVLIGARDNHSLMAIMAFPNERLSLFDVENPLEAQDSAWWDTPDMTTKCTLTADAFKGAPHWCHPGRNRTEGMKGSFPALSKRH